MSYPSSPAAPGWYADPAGDASLERWWDGTQWTAGARRTSPTTVGFAASAAPPGVMALQPRPVPPAYGTMPPLGYGLAVAAPVGAWRSPVDSRPYIRGMSDAIRVVFAKYAAFDGRASRSEYWYWALVNAIAVFGGFLGLLIPFVGVLLYLALIVWALGVFVPNLAVTVRRLRDAGFAWPWLFLGLVPGGSIALIVMAALPSKYP